MGVKTIYLFAGLGIVSMAIQITCCFLPLHVMSLFLAPMTPGGTFDTFMLSYQAEKGSILFCGSWPRSKSKNLDKWCTNLEGPSDLASVTQRYCSEGVKTWFPTFCEAFTHAYYTGLIMLIAIIFNIAMMGIACYLLLDYVNRSLKQSTRTTALIVHGAGTFLLVVAASIYAALTLQKLADVSKATIFNFLTVSATGGAGYGYIFLWVAILVQLIMLAISSTLSTSREMTDEERAEAKLRNELAADYGAAGPLTNAPQQGYDGSAGYGVAAPAYGYAGYAPPVGGMDFGPPPPAFGNAPAQGMMPPPPQMGAYAGGPAMTAPGPTPAW